MRLPFTKMHGLGNDFIVFEAASAATLPDAARLQAVWGQNWTRASGGSRIIFSNGDLDPWSYGGVDDDVQAHDDDPERPVVLHIAKGAHHLDLRAPDPADPPSVVIAREQETAALARWLDML